MAATACAKRIARHERTRHGLAMTAAVIVAEANPLTEHLALLIIAVAAAGALLLIASFAALLVSTCRDRSTRRPEPEPTKATKSSPNPFGDPD